MPTDAEKRLSQCIENVRCGKEKTEQECDLAKWKVKCLKSLLVPDMQMTDEELKNLVTEGKEYRQKMAKAEVTMKSTASAFMAAHSATMEVLGVAGEVKYHEKFSKKGSRDIRCMFCSMVFNNIEVRKRHILTANWKVFEATVFLINIFHFCIEVQLQVHMHVQVYMHSLYMKICHFLVHVILFFLIFVEEGTSN